METLCRKLTRLGEVLTRLEVTPEMAAPELLQALTKMVDTPVTALCVHVRLGWQWHVHLRVAQDAPVARLVTEIRQIMERAIGRQLPPRVQLSLEDGDSAVAHLGHWVLEPMDVPDYPRGYLLAGGDRALSEETTAVVKLLSMMAALSLSNGALYRDLARERDRANLLLEATMAFHRAVENAELRRIALDHLSRDLRMPQGVWLSGVDFRMVAVVGLLPAMADALKGSGLDPSLVPLLMDRKLGTEPVPLMAPVEERRRWEVGIGFVPVLAIPIDADGEREIVLLGDLSRPDYQPTPDDLILARTMAWIGSGVLRRNRLMEELEGAKLDAIKALASAVDAKDHYTHSHSGNVSRLAEAIARHMGLPADQRELARLGGLLHDLGKIGIPESLLNKQAPLDPAEYLRVKQHPLIGERIAASIQGLGEVAKIIRAHHERYDGTGYPDQLKGQQIPLVARIVTVADSFDAMTTDRPYRKGLAPHQVIPHLLEKAGSQFDPAVVRALAEILAQRGQRVA